MGVAAVVLWLALAGVVLVCADGVAGLYCPPGHAPSSGSGGTTFCAVCPAGTYSSGGESASCRECEAEASGTSAPGSTWSLPGAWNVSLCRCASGFAFVAPAGDGSVFSCEPCPPGALCARGTEPPLPAAPGWYRLDAAGTRFAPCAARSACGGPSGCDAGHTGELCGACARGYYRIHWECHECSAAPILRMAAVLGGYVAVMGAVTLTVPVGVLRGWLPLVMAFLQDIGLVYLLPVVWPRVVGTALKWASVSLVNADLLALECVFPGLTFYQLWGVSLLGPVLVVAVVSTAYVSAVAVCGRSEGSGSGRSMVARMFSNGGGGSGNRRSTMGGGARSDRAAHATNAVVYMLLVVHPLFLFKAVSLFACEGHGAAGTRLIFAAHIPCYDRAWWLAMPVAAAASALGAVVAPAGLAALLLHVGHARHDRDMALKYGALYVSFRPSMYGWVAIKASFRAVLAGLACTTYTPVLVVVASLMVRFAVLLAEAFFMPYLRPELNAYHIACLIATFVAHLFGLSLVALGDGADADAVWRIALAVAGIMAVVLLALAVKAGEASYFYLRKFSRYHIPFKFKSSDRAALKALVVSRVYRLFDRLDEDDQRTLVVAANTVQALQAKRLHKRGLGGEAATQGD
ncbi:uncharacterized protein AMSG_03060 [Thecamonas trahens ATCC 50062]|uniref:DUF7630 domain-containing protein n=1 Tax=Thecamonas trahens ATCC 50062 TaxID=461836 RepID=A0A0L0D5P8_THETB|nr:hypothetical protein AMSG_03060 [Thecamonas trahens ATCC 50062]KNC46623.1 hypothetical protein AMSG_03060 [Thecamonas trahens ATCC 50062]|eukprot:XP_013760396.1 hypothetical protein AMSG_03060 [Thecamonas trahens ATCC 50062]